MSEVVQRGGMNNTDILLLLPVPKSIMICLFLHLDVNIVDRVHSGELTDRKT